MQAIKDEFGSTRDLTIDMYYEYLDLNRFPGKDYQQQILSLYATKYGHKPIDLVIVVSEVVLNFWLEHRAEIAPNPPWSFATFRQNASRRGNFPGCDGGQRSDKPRQIGGMATPNPSGGQGDCNSAWGGSNGPARYSGAYYHAGGFAWASKVY